MKYVIVSMFALLVWMPKVMRAQVIVKTGYISSSSYKDENGQQTGGKGDLKFVEGSVNIPVSQKLNERKQPTIWVVSAGGGYTSMNNQNLQSCIDTDFIRQFKPNLSLGAGLAINKSSHFIALCQ